MAVKTEIPKILIHDPRWIALKSPFSEMWLEGIREEKNVVNKIAYCTPCYEKLAIVCCYKLTPDKCQTFFNASIRQSHIRMVLIASKVTNNEFLKLPLETALFVMVSLGFFAVYQLYQVGNFCRYDIFYMVLVIRC